MHPLQAEAETRLAETPRDNLVGSSASAATYFNPHGDILENIQKSQSHRSQGPFMTAPTRKVKQLGGKMIPRITAQASPRGRW